MPSWRAQRWRIASVFVSQMQMTPSRPALAARGRFAADGVQKPTPSTHARCSYQLARTVPFSSCTRFTRPSTRPTSATGLVAWLAMQLTAPSASSMAAGVPDCKQCTTCPVRGFHTRTVASSEPVTIALPSPEKAPQVTEAACAANICMHSPSGTFHIQHVVSSEPTRRTCPRWCQASQLIASDGPSTVHARDPSATFHTATMPSKPAVARRTPSWLNPTASTVSRWPRSSLCCAPESIRHRKALSSPPPLARRAGSAGHAARV
mmetsp:Transcript_18862/g.50725  ORF Transcript_18862/g.50725 Transcript_18862/m.50725 type:complete len:264 (+) Transcript_18862:463-1254(+)